jgi:type II secretory pathway pseudopilin PulG
MPLKPRIRSRNAEAEHEAGYMLLAVVVMCALVLIALAVAAPLVAKDIRREKEVESVHRMQQYVRAIQLYQRQCKCATYPPSMDALEKGTNVRFLRKKWVDPLTGKSNWRVISNPQTTVKGFFGQELAGLTAGLGSAAGMASSTGSGLGSSTTSTTTISSGGLASGFNGAQFSTTSGATGATGSTGSTGSSGSTGGTGDTGMFGDSNSGGVIKGVGTSRTGESILTPNQQTTYETWEFWYDPRIELLKRNVNILGGGGGMGSGSSSTSSTSASSFGIGLNGSSNGATGSTGSTGASGSTGTTGSTGGFGSNSLFPN